MSDELRIPFPTSNTHPAVRKAYSLGWGYCFYLGNRDGTFHFISLNVRDGKRATKVIEAQTIDEAVDRLAQAN